MWTTDLGLLKLYILEYWIEPVTIGLIHVEFISQLGYSTGKLQALQLIVFLGPLLLTWFNFNPSMDK